MRESQADGEGAGPPRPLRPRAGFSFSQEPLKLISTESQPTLSLRKLALAKMCGSRELGQVWLHQEMAVVSGQLIEDEGK